jgi:hypothetical protein
MEKKKRKCEKWGEKVCHSSSLGHSKRRSLRTVARSGNSLPAYFRTATRQTIEVLGTDTNRSRENKRERDEPWGFSRKIMGFNKNPAYITVDLRSFTGLLLLLLIVSYPLTLYHGTHMQATCRGHDYASWQWNEMIHAQQKAPLSRIISTFDLN